jgi:hypothetical protein
MVEKEQDGIWIIDAQARTAYDGRNGSAVWVNVQGTPMYNADREFKGIVGTFSVSQDQTEPLQLSAY